MGGKYSSVPCTRDSAHKTFEPTDSMSTYAVCTRRVFGGIGHRTQAILSGALGYPRPSVDVCKCIMPLCHGVTLNSLRSVCPLVRLVEGEERWEAFDHPQGCSLKMRLIHVTSRSRVEEGT
ncbi:hypothetical protein TNCV_5013641 [Trichonephila clavipes]|nr:hypothetical protein TNCV_5013641 [Trichonephila clavipes]